MSHPCISPTTSSPVVLLLAAFVCNSPVNNFEGQSETLRISGQSFPTICNPIFAVDFRPVRNWRKTLVLVPID